MEWISVKEKLPDEEDYCLFALISHGASIKDYVGKFSSVKKYRKFELQYQYTHWIKLPEPPKN